jgi:dipeptidyl aminopeptidase/acylaminoacyl peptidase
MAASDWSLRFTAPQVRFPAWSAAAPDHLAYVGTESGSWQVWALDLASGERRRITDDPVGIEHVMVAPNGRIVWWVDDSGAERGRWMSVTFDGGEPEPLVPTAPDGWAAGISFAEHATAFGIATDEAYRAFRIDDGGTERLLRESPHPMGVGRLEPAGTGGISADGRLVCVRHADHGDISHQALRVYDERGAVVADLEDAGSHLDPVAWSPVPGDARLAFTSELGAFERPAIWNLDSGVRRDLDVDLPGAVIPLDWWPDGSALLARHEHEGIDTLHRIDAGTGAAELVADPDGDIPDAAVRPDGEVWLLTSSGEHAARVTTSEGRDVLTPGGLTPPPGRRLRSFWFENPQNQKVQAFVVTPPGNGPFPTVISVHGGPEWHERDTYDPETQAFVDAGYAVALPNYRGSTGYGIAFRRALTGDPWLPESEDVVACVDALIAAGIADPGRVAFVGWSWGGCLACLNAGLNPDRWRAIVAGIPSGDFVAAHHACMPEIQAYDVALYGGTPEELPAMWAERDPMTYVDRVTAPSLVIAGEQDPRCPLEGIMPWIDALKARGVPVDVHLYPTGHHANDMGERVRQMQLILDFVDQHLPPVTDPP